MVAWPVSMPGMDMDVEAGPAGLSPHIGVMSPEGGMVACMTMDWTEANDSISSATSAAATEAIPARLPNIAKEHRGVSATRHTQVASGEQDQLLPRHQGPKLTATPARLESCL